MRYLKLSLRHLQQVASNRLALRRVPSLLAVAGLLSLTPVFGDEPAETAVKANTQAATSREQAHPESIAMPVCLEELKLSAPQQAQVKDIIQNYDRSISMVWKQFSERYMQTINMESSLLAAIEDNLTEAQRKQVRDQRRKMAQHEKVIASTDTKVNQAKVKDNEETTKPTNAAEEGLATVEVSLTDEQEAAADKVQEKYRGQLRSLNRDIQGLHTRLVSLEADKLVEIEKVLTKEQLAQLRTSRQNSPVAQKMAVGRTSPAATK